MECDPVTTLEEAVKDIPSSLVPVAGLRRGADGALTADALAMITDGLKSRGIDPTNQADKDRILKELSTLLCKVNSQYQVILREIRRALDAGAPIEKSLLAVAEKKNLFMVDVLVVSRHMYGVKPFDETESFIEGWQDTRSVGGTPALEGFFPGIAALEARLRGEREAFQSGSREELRKHMVEVTREKNKQAANYLSLYGFMNLVAVGLLLYIGGLGRGGGA
jgi:hypothetical protein